MKKGVIILLVCSLAFSSFALPWQSNLEKIKICGMQCAQRTARLTAQLLSMEEPQEKLRAAAAITFLSGCLYGMLVVPDKFFGSIGEDFEKKYDQYPKIKPRAIGSLLNWYRTKNNNKNYQQIN